jgi:hypothetical protein
MNEPTDARRADVVSLTTIYQVRKGDVLVAACLTRETAEAVAATYRCLHPADPVQVRGPVDALVRRLEQTDEGWVVGGWGVR